MLRLLVILLLSVHAALHGLGFAKAFHLMQLSELRLPLSRAFGLFWLLAGMPFLITAALYLLKQNYWWAIAALAVFCSQILIVLAWQDAKAGTIINLLIIGIALLAFGSWRIEEGFNSRLSQLGTTTITTAEPSQLKQLPAIVQTWLKTSDALTCQDCQDVYLSQRGQMLRSPDGSPTSFHSRQYVNLSKPGFVWHASAGEQSLMRFGGLDSYIAGRGQMQIWLWDMIPMVNAKGQKIDQGAAVRFLSEMVWYPWYATNSDLQWEEIDAQTARVHLTDPAQTVTGTFQFTSNGIPISFEADRFYGETGSLEKWQISIDSSSVKSFEGLRVPTKAQVTWHLPAGDFTWLEMELTGLSPKGPPHLQE